uniref:ribosomal protein L23 n=1 Tax=Timspurckia oligopyrenoides TaxID=708627 RepID=UPI001FCDC054|nr:ribosomal protein L23 [Timspurckia oligopyrenoides]UNJ17544.1 ribosomal protein L23 [Timspurckia oligopyrenoides]
MIKNIQRDFLDIIKYPIITDKTTRLLEENQYSFIVDPKANKTIIKQAIEYIFEVKILAVNTYHVPKKSRTLGRFSGTKPHYKRAIITLAPGNSINLFPSE